jgi:membrane-associated phospholipid phosphatase
VSDAGTRAQRAATTLVRSDRAISETLARHRGTRIALPGHLLGRGNAWPTWAALAAGFAATGERGREAARHGVVAGATSSIINKRVLKPVIDRPRPLGAHRTTPSFPSGHAATGAAFATGVALEWPAAGVVAVAASLVVSAGRVGDGQHHLLDVVAGSALGIGVAVATRAVLRRRSGSRSPR